MFSRFISRRPSISSWTRALLLCMGLLEELIAGIPFVALPLLRDRLALSYAQIGLLFTVSTLSGLLFDPLINLLSDRGSKKPWLIAGLCILSLDFIVIGTTTSYPLLLVAFAIYYPAAGVPAELGEAVLIDAAPAESVRTIARSTLLSSVGDFLAPLLVAAFAALHLGWTALCALASALWLSAALLLAPLRFPVRYATAEQDGETSIWTHLRDALRDPILLRWSVLMLLPTMVDEIFLGFVALYLHDAWHINEATIALILTLQMSASFLGLFLLERLLLPRNFAPVRLLTWFALSALVGMLGLLLARVFWLVVVSLLLIHLSCAGWYPLIKAEAYARKPESSGVVRTIISMGQPIEMALPGVVGLIAASFGILAGLSVLALAPVLLLLLLPQRRLR